MGNLFEAAKATEIVKPTPKGKAKPQIAVKDLRMYAALKAAQKTIETMVETLKESVNVESMDAFIESGRSDSIQGVDGDTTASLQLRKRNARSVLGDQEVVVLDQLGISTELSSNSKFYINGKYSEDTDLLGKVSDALDGIVPEDFLGHTGDKYVTTATSVNEAMAIEDKDTRRDVLHIVCTQAARTKFGGSHDEMLSILSDVLKPAKAKK